MIILLLVFCLSHFAQTEETAPCPGLQVAGPGGLVAVGDKIRFVAILTSFPKSEDFEFVWSVKDGKIVGGQGTKAITVLVTGPQTLAMIEILGLPSRCGKLTGMETIVYPDAPPRSKKVGEFVFTDSKIDYVFFDEFVRNLKENPNYSGYIFVGSNAVSPQVSFDDRASAIRILLTGNYGIQNYNIVLVNLSNTHNLTHLFIVPPGADPPNPDSIEFDSKSRNTNKIPNVNEVEPCPIIRINGPKSPFLPNSAQAFTAEVDRKGNYEIEYKWTVSGGEILDGQGTPNIKVFQHEKLAGATVSVTVELIGLPGYCGTKTATDTAPPWDPPRSFQIDEIKSYLREINTQNLDNLANYLKKDRNSKAEIIWYTKAVLSAEVIETESKRITEFLTKEMQIENERFTIRNAVSDSNYVQFWIVPAGARSPTSGN